MLILVTSIVGSAEEDKEECEISGKEYSNSNKNNNNTSSVEQNCIGTITCVINVVYAFFYVSLQLEMTTIIIVMILKWGGKDLDNVHQLTSLLKSKKNVTSAEKSTATPMRTTITQAQWNRIV